MAHGTLFSPLSSGQTSPINHSSLSYGAQLSFQNLLSYTHQTATTTHSDPAGELNEGCLCELTGSEDPKTLSCHLKR